MSQHKLCKRPTVATAILGLPLIWRLLSRLPDPAAGCIPQPITVTYTILIKGIIQWQLRTVLGDCCGLGAVAKSESGSKGRPDRPRTLVFAVFKRPCSMCQCCNPLKPVIKHNIILTNSLYGYILATSQTEFLRRLQTECSKYCTCQARLRLGTFNWERRRRGTFRSAIPGIHSVCPMSHTKKSLYLYDRETS